MRKNLGRACRWVSPESWVAERRLSQSGLRDRLSGKLVVTGDCVMLGGKNACSCLRDNVVSDRYRMASSADGNEYRCICG